MRQYPVDVVLDLEELLVQLLTALVEAVADDVVGLRHLASALARQSHVLGQAKQARLNLYRVDIGQYYRTPPPHQL